MWGFREVTGWPSLSFHICKVGSSHRFQGRLRMVFCSPGTPTLPPIHLPLPSPPAPLPPQPGGWPASPFLPPDCAHASFQDPLSLCWSKPCFAFSGAPSLPSLLALTGRPAPPLTLTLSHTHTGALLPHHPAPHSTLLPLLPPIGLHVRRAQVSWRLSAVCWNATLPGQGHSEAQELLARFSGAQGQRETM